MSPPLESPDPDPDEQLEESTVPQETVRQLTPNDLLWIQEKPLLLRTHRGWYVAYHGGERIALEPTQAKLQATINRKLGVPHTPCDFHEIVEKPAARRGPSPRLQSSG
ncbi:MAG: hypothetical protein ABIA92_03505 [Patescibacteria group bacterium]